MAEAYDMAAAPHAPYGPIALAATLQVDVCSPNVFIQEQSLGIHYNKGFDLLDFIKNKRYSSIKMDMWIFRKTRIGTRDRRRYGQRGFSRRSSLDKSKMEKL